MVTKTDAEIQQVLAILQGALNEAHDQEAIDALNVQIWVMTFRVMDEDAIFDRGLEAEAEAAAFRAQEWLMGIIETEGLIVV